MNPLGAKKYCIGRRSDGTPCWNTVKKKDQRCDECWEDLSTKGDSSQMKEITELPHVPEWVLDRLVEAAEADFLLIMGLTTRDDLTKEQILGLIDAMFKSDEVDPVWLAEQAGSTESSMVLERIANNMESYPANLDTDDMREIAWRAKYGDNKMWKLLDDTTKAVYEVFMAG